MLLEGNKLWLFFSELADAGISENYCRKKICQSRKLKTSSWKGRPHPEDKRIKLIDYDSIPETTRAKLPTREELINRWEVANLEQQLEEQDNAFASLDTLHKQHTYELDYHFFLKQTLNPSKANDLVKAAGWLRLLSTYRSVTETRSIGFDKKSLLRTAVVEKLISNAKKRKGAYLYGFKVTNVSVLQRKELAWIKAHDEAAVEDLPSIEAEKQANQAALATLVPDSFGNNNRRVLGRLNEDESKRILIAGGKIDLSEWNAKVLVWLFMNPVNGNKYDFENIYRRYLYKCNQESRKPAVTITAVKEFLTSDEIKKYTTRERSGWAAHDKMLPHVFGKRPQYALSKGGYDGLQVDFNSRIDGKQLMLTVVAVFDYASEAITGFDIGLVEDGKMVRTMYRNHLALLGGRSYIEIESDRFSGNLAAETQQIFTRTCRFVTQPAPNDPQGKAPNPKARFVERLIQELNRLAQNFPGWKGTNITSIDRNRKPNPDYRNGNYVEGFAESKEQIISLVNAYNHDTYNRTQSRWQVLQSSLNPEAPVIAQETIAMLLNQHTVVKVTNGVVAFERNRREYEYEFKEFDQYVHKMMKGMRVKVFFDETDMSTVDVFGESDEFIARLGALKRVSRAKAEQTAEDLAQLGKFVNWRDESDERISRKALEVEASMYGIDISGLNREEAEEVVLGARETRGMEEHITAQELFNEALTSSEAKQHASFYEDRLIRANGEAVPVLVTKEERKTDERKLRELERARFNANGERP